MFLLVLAHPGRPGLRAVKQIVFVVLMTPLPSNRNRQSNDDYLKGKRENYQVCSVQYCAQQLFTVQCTRMNRPNSSLDWVLSYWAHFTVLRFISVYVYIVYMRKIVTW